MKKTTQTFNDLLRFAHHHVEIKHKLYAALREAVDCYGKPGGPWNVPGDPGGWLHRAREALEASERPAPARTADTPAPRVETPFPCDSGASDAVNHPAHYTSSPARCECGKPVECIQVVENMGFNDGNAVKYLWRSHLKGDAVQDLEKAAWYLRREIERLKREAV